MRELKPTKIVNYPWPHMVIDDFLDPEDFERIKEQCLADSSRENYKDDGRSENDMDCLKVFLDEDPIEDYRVMEYMKYFKHRREFNKLDKLIHWANTLPNCVEHVIHDELTYKVLSVVLYVSPEKHNGTWVYDTEMNYVAELEFKPNRLIIFCGSDQWTWHKFEGNGIADRFTLNWFGIDSDHTTGRSIKCDIEIDKNDYIELAENDPRDPLDFAPSVRKSKDHNHERPREIIKFNPLVDSDQS